MAFVIMRSHLEQKTCKILRNKPEQCFWQSRKTRKYDHKFYLVKLYLKTGPTIEGDWQYTLICNTSSILVKIGKKFSFSWQELFSNSFVKVNIQEGQLIFWKEAEMGEVAGLKWHSVYLNM